nr:sialin-like [Ciona intestinalis]|eukprot:XP_002124275.3 sialin-like [Ciona intestinalis]
MESVKEVNESATIGCYVKARYVLALMGFLGMVNVHCMRLNLSVAIVAMVNYTSSSMGDNTTINSCQNQTLATLNSSTYQQTGQFTWNPEQQGLLLGSYFYGYVLSNIPGAWLSKKFGFRLLVAIQIILGSIVTFLSPIAAKTSFELFFVPRVLLGMCQGGVAPSLVMAWGTWAPPSERSLLISIPLSGSAAGAVISFPLAGVIAQYWGWEAVFYVTGGVAMIWCIVWLSLIHNTPMQHPRISDEERSFIAASIGADPPGEKKQKTRTPWGSMLTSLPVHSIFISHFASNWSVYTLFTMLPTYMSTMLNFNVTASGMVSSVPFILQWVFTVASGYISDVIIRRRIRSVVFVRKMNTAIGLFIPAFFVVLAGYVGCDVIAVVIFFSLSVAFGAFAVPGCKANASDVSPKYGGIVFGISNTIANMAGFLGPQVAGILLQQGNNLSQWQSIFWISACINTAGAFIYLVFATADEQSWSKGKAISTPLDDSKEELNK